VVLRQFTEPSDGVAALWYAASPSLTADRETHR
jgi:hypothetical protein